MIPIVSYQTVQHTRGDNEAIAEQKMKAECCATSGHLLNHVINAVRASRNENTPQEMLQICTRVEQSSAEWSCGASKANSAQNVRDDFTFKSIPIHKPEHILRVTTVTGSFGSHRGMKADVKSCENSGRVRRRREPGGCGGRGEAELLHGDCTALHGGRSARARAGERASCAPAFFQ